MPDGRPPFRDRYTGPVPSKKEGRTMTRDRASSIGASARGQPPQRRTILGVIVCEGIGRRLLVRKNRKNKKEDQVQNSDNASDDGNPFKRDRTRVAQGYAGRTPRTARRYGAYLRRCGVHRERRGSSFEADPHKKGRDDGCQAGKRRRLKKNKKGDPTEGKRFQIVGIRKWYPSTKNNPAETGVHRKSFGRGADFLL